MPRIMRLDAIHIISHKGASVLYPARSCTDIYESLERMRFGFIVIKAHLFAMKIDVLCVHEL